MEATSVVKKHEISSDTKIVMCFGALYSVFLTYMLTTTSGHGRFPLELYFVWFAFFIAVFSDLWKTFRSHTLGEILDKIFEKIFLAVTMVFVFVPLMFSALVIYFVVSDRGLLLEDAIFLAIDLILGIFCSVIFYVIREKFLDPSLDE